MKFNKKLYTMALGTIAFGGLLASCSNELNEPTFGPVDGNGSVNLVHTPDVYAWSGNEDLGNNTRSFGTRGNQEAPYNGHKPKDITEEEVNAVVDYFKTHEGKSDAVSKDFKNFYVQQVYYDDGPFTDRNGSSYTGVDCVVEIEVRDKVNGSKLDNVFSGNDKFNKCRYLYNSSSLDFWYNNSKCSYWSNNFKMVYIPGYGYYVGFDVEGQPDDSYPANNNMHITNSPDGYYYDRIIKIVPADENGNPIYDNEGDEGDDDDDDNDDTIGDDNNGNVTIEDKRHFGEVEVNLSVNDVHINDGGGQKYDYADLWTKLSIHVRKGTNVKVVLPVPTKYMVESDDFAIFQKHELGGGVTSGDMAPDIDPTQRIQSMTYTITDPESERSWPVKLIIEFKNVNEDSNYPDGCIIVRTTGIDKNLIDYLWKKNGDGINFEVWNYFQTDNLGSNQPVIGDDGLKYSTDLTHSRLQKILNGETEYGKSTIQFLDDAPDFYINAFGFEWTASGLQGTHNTNINPWDCTVIPVDTATFPSAETYYCYHLNSTPWNIIWVNNNVEKKGAAYEAHVNYFYHPTEGYIRVKFPWEQQ